MENYGRNRQSIADIEHELNNIFDKHPNSQLNAEGDPVVPGDNVLDILDSFSDLYDGVPLLSESEVGLLQQLLSENPGLEVTPTILLQFIAEKTKSSPPRSPGFDEDERGFDDERGHRRSGSDDSDGTSYHPGTGSRPPSRGPTTPGASAKSPLDSERRQRSTPLIANPPSSWASKRPPRRKSDAGSKSDNEGGTPSAWGRSGGGRTRTPSNPTSPTTSSRDLAFSPGSPPDFGGPRSRPASRNGRSGSRNGFNNSSFDRGYGSSDDNHTARRPLSRYGYNNHDTSFEAAVSTLPMPGNHDDDSDDEDMGYIHSRSTTTSMVSMEDSERMEAMQRTNEELGRKLVETERTLANKLEEHDAELEEIHLRFEELRSELSASNREEKELRAKDSRNMAQIAALEAEVAKVQKALDSAKATYSSLQKQYQEQCAFSERYRDDLRRRDEAIRSLKEAASLHEIEVGKFNKEHETYEERLAGMEQELNDALAAHVQLDEQKQENLLLKETIDRMRYDMDEMRNAAAAAAASTLVGNGTSSAANTISKSLGAELAGKMKFDLAGEEVGSEDLSSDTSTAVDDEEQTAGEEDAEEDVVETIITKRKRKVASRANVIEASTRRQFEELKEYSDSATQYDPTLFAVNHSIQTDPERKPVKASFSIQTDAIPEPKPLAPPPPRITVEMEIQTDRAEEEPSRSPSPAHDESMASSSSTIVPPTPKPALKNLDLLDEPPAYAEADQEEREWRVAAETLKKWHKGVKVPFEPVEGGISEETVEEWKILKRELGVECTVIDKIVAASVSSGPSTSRGKDGKAPVRRGGRFYNIYNTYVYGDKGAVGSVTSGLAGQAIMFVGASALVILAVTPYMMPYYSVPGGATYYDRAAWNSFNSMQAAGEGFSPDGTAAVWNFLGRVGGGAARMARGWPT